MSILEEIVERTVRDLEERRREVPLSELEGRVGTPDDRRGFMEALSRPGIAVIAEHKRASPSKGTIRGDLSVADVALAYERGGAGALSVLTEPNWFKGSLADITAARAAAALPVLRKDFIVDPYQIYEAAAAGADAVLLIVAALHPDDLAVLLREARALDLDALVEIHDEDELKVALEVEADLLGINNRDLRDFTIDLHRTFDLLADIPAGKLVVSESGIATPAQLLELERVGVDAVLVGERLMRAEDLEAATVELARGTHGHGHHG